MLLYYLCPKKYKNFLILIASLIFYGYGEPIYVALMLASICVGYAGALLIHKEKENKQKRICIFVTILVINLSALVFFKYYGFIIDNINSLFNLNLKIKQLPLPLGISFYTFQLISYVIDVYKNEVKVQKNFVNFAAYVSMFPQLVAGPIVQYSTIEKQLNERDENINDIGAGIEKFILGLGKKVLIANNVGIIWTTIKAMPQSELSVVTSWIGIIAFTLQIYFDFSGYSDMAIGLGKMFGFDFLKNFNYPYISTSITEFWRRWHISLGNWFRDYIYIPLGGNRIGKAKQIRNIFIVWFVTGLWHGASWNFIIWGVYFGVLLLIEKLFLLNILKKLPKVLGSIYTMFFVIISWVFFDTDTIMKAFNYIKSMFGINSYALYDSFASYTLRTNFIILFIAILCSTPLAMKFIKFIKQYSIGKVFAIFIYIMILIASTAFLVGESYNPFLYFRF